MANNGVPREGFLFDTGEQNLTLSQSLNVTLQNPAGSGKKIIIEGYSFINQVSTLMMANLIHMPTGNLPTATIIPFPYVVGPDVSSPSNVGVFKVAKGAAMTGGTIVIGVPLEPSARNYIEATPLTVLPGTTLGITVSAIVAAKITIAIYTREEML